MKLDCKFHSLDYSQALVDFTEKRFQKLKKFEMKPVDVHVTYSADRHNKLVEVYFNSVSGPVRAKASADTFENSVDKVLHKLVRQMGKEKSKVQNHKSPECTAESKLNAMNSLHEEVEDVEETETVG
ncbi:MAG: ribosome-associated translation inhibitor RaiA [Bdellovibrionales bacterium]|nr:ribosome-associated translation inhibitor RaiA [Bdellovibrionales bacterium]